MRVLNHGFRPSSNGFCGRIGQRILRMANPCSSRRARPAAKHTRHVSTGTLATLRVHAEEALLKIWEIWDGQLTWNDFFALPAPLFSATIQLEWQARNSEELEHVNGWMQSQIIGLLKNLEALPFLTPRPSSGFVRSAALQRQYRIGLRQLPQRLKSSR